MNVTNLDDTEAQRIDALFVKNIECFCDAMAIVMAYIIVCRRRTENPMLDSLNPKEFFEFDGGELKVNSAFLDTKERVAHVASCFKLATPDAAELAAADQEFRRNAGAEKFIRGKYLMWAFVESALAVHRSIGRYCAKYATPPKARATLGLRNAMVLFGTRVRIPASLRRFLDENYLSYIRQVDPRPQSGALAC